MSPQLKRREFITLVGGAMAAWPLAARAQQAAMPVIRFLSQGSASSTAAEAEAFRAQQPERMRRIGVLMNVAADDSEAPARIGAFSAELGWTIGRNVRIDYRWYAGNADAARKYAAELIALAPDIVLASGTLGVTATINRPVPIVFTLVAIRSARASSTAWPAGRQRHWLHALRIQLERKVAGIAQADRTAHDASAAMPVVGFGNNVNPRIARGDQDRDSARRYLAGPIPCRGIFRAFSATWVSTTIVRQPI